MAAAAWPSSAPAQSRPPAGFEKFKHVRWGAEEGAPNVAQFAQTPDGYLWLSGSSLYRFDGISFERMDWPAGSEKPHLAPFGLMVSRAGELWVGLRRGGGVAVYRNGGFRDTRMPDPPNDTGYLVQTPDGAIWAGSATRTKRLHRLRNGRWERVDETLRLPEGAIMSMVVAPNGTIWIALSRSGGMSGTLAFLRPGDIAFGQWPSPFGPRVTASLDPAGALWVSDGTMVRKILHANGARVTPAVSFPAPEGLRFARLVFDPGGGIWGSTASIGAFHISPSGAPRDSPRDRVHVFDASHGLTSDIATAAFVDREGSVWIGTENGFDMFRNARAVQEPSIPGNAAEGLEMVRAKGGDMYFATNGSLLRLTSGGRARPIIRLNAGVTAICPARSGGIWVVDRTRVSRIVGQEVVSAAPAHLPSTLYSCAEDGTGNVWGASARLWRFDGRKWQVAARIRTEEEITELETTSSGEVFFLAGTVLGSIRDGQTGSRNWAPARLGTLRMVTADGNDILAGGSGGLLRIRNGRTAFISERRFPWLASTRGVVRTPRGETWLMTQYEVSRVQTADLERAFDDPRARLPRTVFNAQDGLLSASQHVGFWGRQMLLGADGRIWLLNRFGAAYFDPAALRPNRLPPPVSIRALLAADKTYPDPKNLTLAAGTRSFEIAYAALSLVMPERVQFRYRLEGVDDGWVDPHGRRSASYSNVGPGHYRFQVIAANNDGVWNRTGAMLEIDIPPTFQQGWLFKLLCAAVLVALLWFLYALRLRTVSARIRSHMAERMAERERIARELHDTLLQSVQSLTLRFQLAVEDLSKRHPARQGLEDAIDLADRVIAEGRDRVRDLRSIQDSDLEQIICDLIAAQAFDPEVEISIKSTGVARSMDPLVLDEISRIAGEAVFNVRKHAGATRLSVRIEWGPNLRLHISDNGVGIAKDVLVAGERKGHFGLQGMRERARRLDGELSLAALPEGGTELVLTVPGRIAYKLGKTSPLKRFWSS